MDDRADAQRQATAWSLAVDAVCAEVVTAWRRGGIEPILLKGPTIAQWLYPDEVRPYGDADLLVDPAQILDAAAILARLGFSPVGHHVSIHAHPWQRADGGEVDLHGRLYGLHEPPELVWPELAGWCEPFTVAGVPVRALALPGRALHIALHAAQHAELAKPQEDLRRALASAPGGVWRDAARLADRIGGLPTMAAGLALSPAGEQLIQELPLVRAARVASTDGAPLAIGFARLGEARGAVAKARVLAGALRRSERRHPRAWPALGLSLLRTVLALARRRAFDRKRA